jgi:hypothetical protein
MSVFVKRNGYAGGEDIDDVRRSFPHQSVSQLYRDRNFETRNRLYCSLVCLRASEVAWSVAITFEAAPGSDGFQLKMA